MAKYLVILLGKDSGAEKTDIAIVNFKIVDANGPNEALAKWKPVTEEVKSDRDSWYIHAMKQQFVENKITTDGQWKEDEWVTQEVGKVYMHLSDDNSYDFIVAALDSIQQDIEYATYLTVTQDEKYHITYPD